MDVIGYELLYRSYGTENSANVVDGDKVTAMVFFDTISEIGLDNIVDNKLAFINFTRRFFIEKDLIPLPKDFDKKRVVLEVLEDIALDSEVINGIRNLQENGYSIALDDVSSVEQVASILKTGLVSMIKIDLCVVKRNLLPDMVNTFRQYGILLLAEKVETQEDYDTCYRLGFDFFQGYFLCKPNVVLKGRKMEASQWIAMQLLAKVTDPNADFPILEGIISQDVGLSYKLLKLVNSAYFSRSSTIKSIQQAITLIGLNELRGWVTLLVMASKVDKPNELTVIALQRAMICDKIGKTLGDKNDDSFYLIGLFSVLDAFMDMPMNQILANIPLSENVIEALINHRGKLGIVLIVVLAIEQGNWDLALQLGIKHATLRNMYVESIKWATELTNEIYNRDNENL
jgi:EAL and modified HD-GYP domain-containing signal transduction protein